MALQVIYHLDLAMESRQLSPEERDIRARLKRRVIGLASLERSRKKQRARINNLRHGDANTKFFHRKVNCRRRKNFILKLRHNNGWVTTHDEKQRVAQSHFTAAIGRANPRPISFNWDALNLPSPNLEGLDDAFTEKEVKEAIMDMPSDKAPGPDGFNGKFFKTCWDIIKGDVMAAMRHFSDLRARNLHWLNTASIVLLPKKEGPKRSPTLGLLASSMGSPRLWQRFLLGSLPPVWMTLSRRRRVRLSSPEAFMTTSCLFATMLVGFTDGRRPPSSSSSTLGKLLITLDGTTFLSSYNALAFPIDSGIGSWLSLVPPLQGSF
jgi:hypothetical protein